MLLKTIRLSVTIALAVATQCVFADGKPIKIGLLLPYKGVYAPLAEGIDRGFELAVEEFKGSVAGRKIEVIRADDELTAAVGVQKFNKLVRSDGVDIVAGVISSGVAIALTEHAEKTKTPTIFANAFADEVTGKFCNRYVARTSFSANSFEYAAGTYWAKQGKKTVVTLGPDYAAGRAFIGAFQRGFTDAGGKVVNQLWTPFQKTKDWSSSLTTARNSGADFMYSFYAGSEAIQVVKQHSEYGLQKTIPLIGDLWVYDDSLFSALGDAVVGARHTTIFVPDASRPANKAFVDAYRKKHKSEPNVNVVFGYDNAKTILLALQATKGDTTDKLAYMKAVQAVDFESPRGRLRYNADRSAVLEKIYLVEIIKSANGMLSRKLLDSFPGGQDLPGCEQR